MVRPRPYRIVVEGELGPRYVTAFAPMHLETCDGNTELIGPVEDQAELQGLLDSIAALGLALVSVAPVGDASEPERR